MAARKLPQEMIEAIIDHLQDDKPSLKACSLVCKGWTYPTRLHLFSRATVKWPLQPAVFPFVRHLEFRMGMRFTGSHEAPSLDGIIPLLVGFDRIVSLHIILSWQSSDVLNGQSWSTLSKNFSVVTSLSLTHFIFADTAAFAQVVCAFPHLRELRMRSWVRSTSPYASTFRLSPDFHTLDIGDESVGAVLEWLLSLSARPALRTARLIGIKDEDLAALHIFIRVLGKDLESFIVSASVQDWSHHSIDLASLSQLRSITFVISVRSPVGRRRWITQILSHMCSAHLEEVVFRTHLSDRKRNDSKRISNALEWPNVDAVLQRTAFSRLRNVHFSCIIRSSVGSTSDDPRVISARASIMQLLPQCHARGILRVDA